MCNHNPPDMVESFVEEVFGVVATEDETQMNRNYMKVETSAKSKRSQIFLILSQRTCCKEGNFGNQGEHLKAKAKSCQHTTSSNRKQSNF